MFWYQAIILAIVEGLTEFLPISSTGHMVVTSSIMGIGEDKFVKLFEVCIQLGAILSVVILYWKKFFDFSRLSFYLKLIVAFIPAAIFGALFHDKVREWLGNPAIVAWSFIIGGIVLLFIEQLLKRMNIDKIENVSYPKAFIIGCFQVLALIPGVSRSASTIIGGMSQKLTRRLAAEFSFFLAVPTMFAASAKDLWDYHKAGSHFEHGEMAKLIVGGAIAFIVALIAIRSFIQYLQKHSFRAFGVYRIIAGVAVLLLIWKGIIKTPAAEPKLTQPTAVITQ